MINLQQFCEKDDDYLSESRKWLGRPFSRGDWSYASDGRILLRVPRLPDVPEGVAASSKAEELFAEVAGEPFVNPTPNKLPEIDDDEECAECDGRGTAHDCPTCHCACLACDGTGIENPWLHLSIGYGQAVFHALYIARIKDLPDLKFGKPDAEKPMRFQFDGGEGLLMPMRGRCPDHIDLSTTPGDTA
jgi:hypothetical protein